MNYNSAYIAAIVAGSSEGAAFIREVSEFSDPEALANKFISIIAADCPGNPKLRGFAREIQKRLERTTRD